MHGILKRVGTLLITLNLLTLGCDHFHEARVIVDPAMLKSTVNISNHVSEEEVASSVKELASKLDLVCDSSQRPLYILECGPHGKLSLHKEDGKFVISMFQMWGDPRYFCNVQGHMFEYFTQKYGKANVKIETNDNCGRKNYP